MRSCYLIKPSRSVFIYFEPGHKVPTFLNCTFLSIECFKIYETASVVYCTLQSKMGSKFAGNDDITLSFLYWVMTLLVLLIFWYVRWSNNHYLLIVIAIYAFEISLLSSPLHYISSIMSRTRSIEKWDERRNKFTYGNANTCALYGVPRSCSERPLITIAHRATAVY